MATGFQQGLLGNINPADYALRQQQMMMQAQQGMSPYERMGYNIANIAGGLFGVEDPTLKRVGEIQGIYSEVAKNFTDQNSPEFYQALQKAYAERGFAQQAALSAEQALNVESTLTRNEAAKFELFNKNPELLDREIAKAEKSEDLDKVAQLKSLKERVTEARRLDTEYRQAQIDQAKSTAAAQRATAEGKDIIYLTDITGQRIPYERKDGKLVPLAIEGAPAAASPGAGQGKFSQGKKGVYNPKTGKVEYN